MYMSFHGIPNRHDPRPNHFTSLIFTVLGQSMCLENLLLYNSVRVPIVDMISSLNENKIQAPPPKGRY